MAAGPRAVGLRPLRHVPDRPILSLVVDTESEFVWSKGVTDDKGSVESIAQLSRAQDICDPFGARICYVLDHPVASNPSSVPILRALIARGAEIGAHLQPWTTPPVIEPLGGNLAFPGNLPASLERLKLAELKSVIERNFGITPRVYKAGRYGISENTLSTLEELGFDVDLSVTPGFDYTEEGGPDFSRFAASPYHFGRTRPLLELPTTSGFVGYLAALGQPLWEAAGRPQLRGLHLRGLMDRTGGLSRLRLSPEGYDLGQMIRLTEFLFRRGCRHFSLSFHSSTLLAGFTPYSETPADVDIVLAKIRDYLVYFRDRLGGEFKTPTEVFDLYRAAGAFSASA